MGQLMISMMKSDEDRNDSFRCSGCQSLPIMADEQSALDGLGMANDMLDCAHGQQFEGRSSIRELIYYLALV